MSDQTTDPAAFIQALKESASALDQAIGAIIDETEEGPTHEKLVHAQQLARDATENLPDEQLWADITDTANRATAFAKSAVAELRQAVENKAKAPTPAKKHTCVC